jgi:hypothetical protein
LVSVSFRKVFSWINIRNRVCRDHFKKIKKKMLVDCLQWFLWLKFFFYKLLWNINLIFIFKLNFSLNPSMSKWYHIKCKDTLSGSAEACSHQP